MAYAKTYNVHGAFETTHRPEAYPLVSLYETQANPPGLPRPGAQTLSTPNRKWSKSTTSQKTLRISKIAWLLLFVLLVAWQIYLLVLMIQCLSAPQENEKSSMFALYKNTRAAACLEGTSNNANCTLVQQGLADRTDRNSTYIGQLAYGNSTWCDVLSCMSDFKVVPSKPKPVAFSINGLTIFFWINITMLGALWTIRTLLLVPMHEPGSEECKGVGFVDWVMFAIDISSFFFWLAAFGLLASDPLGAACISLTNWLTPWRYSMSVGLHPLSCRLASKQNARKWKKSIFGLTTGVALAQWAATCWALSAKAKDVYEPVFGYGAQYKDRPRYDCILSEISAAPGNSSCSPQQLCANTGLYIDPGFTWDSGGNMVTADYILVPRLYGVFFFIFSALCIPGLVVATMDVFFDRRRTCNIRHFPSWVLCFSLLVMCFVYLLFFLTNTAGYGLHMMTGDREAVVAYDLNCTALHVAMSSWRNFLDVDAYGRGVRTARLWFNS